MRLKGFYWIQEWDGTYTKVTAHEERADLADFLKHGINCWIHMLYTDGIMHKVTEAYFDNICCGHANPNVI